MTPDLLDHEARRATATLFASLDDLDTEGTLAAVHRGMSPAALTPPGRRPGPGRSLLAAACLLVVAGLVGVAVVARSGSDGDRVDTGDEVPVDPASFGPVLGRLTGASDPDLAAVVHGPSALRHGDEIAIAVTGAEPGFAYGAQLCAEADGPAFCIGFDSFVVGADGSALLVVDLPAVFAGAVAHVNDCRTVPCRLLVDVTADDTQTDAEVAIGSLAPRARTDGFDGIDLTFDPDAPAPAVPSVDVEPRGLRSPGVAVRVTGRDLQPGTWLLVAEGAAYPWSGPMRHNRGTHRAELAEVVVDETGVLEAAVTLPLDLSLATDGSVASDGPATLDCRTRTSDGTWCAVRLEMAVADAARIVDDTEAMPLQPDAVPYPGS